MRPTACLLVAIAPLSACSGGTTTASHADGSASSGHVDASASGQPDACAGPCGLGSKDAGHTTPSFDAGTPSDAAIVTYGDAYTGGVYNLGPVDYAETQWHNACAPATRYPAAVQAVEGELLAGLWGNIADVAGYCDACIYVQTAKGKSGLLRVVTYGVTTPNSLDTSQEAYNLLSDGEYPRDMTWVFAKCPDTGPMLYEFQTDSSPWWTSLWVRNARVPLAKVEVKSPNHATWAALTRGSDGSLTDSNGFGAGSFTIRSTGVDGQAVSDTFDWPDAGVGSAFLTGKGNFR